MHFHFKLFVILFISFSIIIGGALHFLPKFDISADTVDQTKARTTGFLDLLDGKATFSENDRESLSIMTEKSHRINVLVMGNDGGRTDTMMMASYDPDTQLIDIVSVPRDTYYKILGYKISKINAVYGLKGEDGGPDGTRKALSGLLGVPISYYISVDYNATKDVVDTLGGIEVDVPFNMDYDDPYSKPPLHINLKKGAQVLNGDKAIQYLRWRHNNDGSGGAEGDLGRIKRQHAFVKLAIKKALGLKLPLLIPTSFKYVKTDMPLSKMAKMGSSMIGIDMAKMRSYQIPGIARTICKTSYYLHYPEDTEIMMLAIYNRTGAENPVVETITKVEDIVDPSHITNKKRTVLSDTDEAENKSSTKEETTDIKKRGDEESEKAELSPIVTNPEGASSVPNDLIDITTSDTTVEDIQDSTP